MSGSRKASNAFVTEEHLNQLAIYTIFQLQRSQGNSLFLVYLCLTSIAWLNQDEYLSVQKIILFGIQKKKKKGHKNPMQVSATDLETTLITLFLKMPFPSLLQRTKYTLFAYPDLWYLPFYCPSHAFLYTIAAELPTSAQGIQHFITRATLRTCLVCSHSTQTALSKIFIHC